MASVTFMSSDNKEVSCTPTTSKHKLHCFWDRHPCDVQFGCPIKYKSGQLVKSYVSEISNEEYTIKENITQDRFNEVKQYKTIEKHYEMEGNFCSFSCCLSWIQDNKHNPVYDNSEILLRQMVRSAKVSIDQLKPAPHWRTLIPYGGVLTIEKFRSNPEYKFHGVCIEPVRQIQYLFEKTCSIQEN